MLGNLGGGTLIKMTYTFTPPNLTGGIDKTIVEVATTVPSFIIGILLFVFGFVFFTGVTSQKMKTGYADIPMWVTMASISTLLITLLLTIKGGMVNIETLSVVVAITIFSALWLFLSRGRGEI